MDDRPNILLITVDTVRPDHLGCYGYPKDTSPNIDRLACEATVFDQAITNGSYTKPAFPVIMSSTYGSMYGGPFVNVAVDRPMLAPLLKEHGYSTAGFTSNPLVGAHVGYDEGFDTFAEPVPPSEGRLMLRIKGAQRLLRVPAVNTILMKLGVDTRPHPVYVGGEEITNLAWDWLNGQDGLFFLWVHYMDAHWPYHIETSLQTAADCAQAWKDRYRMWSGRESYPGDAVVARAKGLYDEGIAFMDRQIGRLVKKVEEAGLFSNTAVIIVSDHGEAFYEHGRWQHGAWFDFSDEILRVPLIIRLPDQTSARRYDGQVDLLGLAPSILDLAKIPIDPRMEGQSLLPILQGPAELCTPVVVSEMVDLDWYCVAIRTEEYKYIYDERRIDHRELYDLLDDPGETTNLHGRLPEVEAEFEETLLQHLARVRSTSRRDQLGGWQSDDDVVRRLQALGYLS